MSDQEKTAAARSEAAGYADALRAERESCVQRGKSSRVKEIDTEIARVSGDLDPSKSARRAPRVERA